MLNIYVNRYCTCIYMFRRCLKHLPFMHLLIVYERERERERESKTETERERARDRLGNYNTYINAVLGLF